jgi:hypothetical protein
MIQCAYWSDWLIWATLCLFLPGCGRKLALAEVRTVQDQTTHPLPIVCLSDVIFSTTSPQMADMTRHLSSSHLCMSSLHWSQKQQESYLPRIPTGHTLSPHVTRNYTSSSVTLHSTTPMFQQPTYTTWLHLLPQKTIPMGLPWNRQWRWRMATPLYSQRQLCSLQRWLRLPTAYNCSNTWWHWFRRPPRWQINTKDTGSPHVLHPRHMWHRWVGVSGELWSRKFSRELKPFTHTNNGHTGTTFYTTPHQKKREAIDEQLQTLLGLSPNDLLPHHCYLLPSENFTDLASGISVEKL